MRHVLTSSTGLQIWPFHVIVSKKTTKKCIKIKKARAGRVARVARVERAEKKRFLRAIFKYAYFFVLSTVAVAVA